MNPLNIAHTDMFRLDSYYSIIYKKLNSASTIMNVSPWKIQLLYNEIHEDFTQMVISMPPDNVSYTYIKLDISNYLKSVFDIFKRCSDMNMSCLDLYYAKSIALSLAGISKLMNEYEIIRSEAGYNMRYVEFAIPEFGYSKDDVLTYGLKKKLLLGGEYRSCSDGIYISDIYERHC